MSVLNVHWKDWCWSWNSNPLATWCEELAHLKRPWCWEGLRAGGEGGDRGWDSWMASPTQWIWVLASSGSWWWTGRPGVLQSAGSQTVKHHFVTEQQQQKTNCPWSHFKLDSISSMDKGLFLFEKYKDTDGSHLYVHLGCLKFLFSPDSSLLKPWGLAFYGR